MLEIVRPARYEKVTSRQRVFREADNPDLSLVYDVDEDGNIISEYATARANFKACLTGVVRGVKVIDQGVQTFTRRVHMPAEGLCTCGATVYLDGDTECDCGRLYNEYGQELESLGEPFDWDDSDIPGGYDFPGLDVSE